MTRSRSNGQHPFWKLWIILLANLILALIVDTIGVCDQKLASDSSGLPGGFSGQRAWVRIFKKWAPGSYCLELVVACPAAGTSALILLVEGS
jgi:hypothetical protein